MNIALAEQAIGRMEADEKLHVQKNWATRNPRYGGGHAELALGECGTACCMAGHVVALVRQDVKFVFLSGQDHTNTYTYVVDGIRVTGAIAQDAAALLDLDRYQEMTLFQAANTLEEIKVFVKNYANEGG